MQPASIGCVTQVNEPGIQEALDAYAEEMRSLGQSLPAPAAITGTVVAA